MSRQLHDIQLQPIIDNALREDWGAGDITTDLCLPQNCEATAQLIAKEPLVVAGIEVAKAVLFRVDPALVVSVFVKNSDRIQAGTIMLETAGSAASILKAERVMLNFLARMCGIATETAKFVALLSESHATLLDTRKTTAGLRLLEKSAVMAGGGRNHRFGLADGVMLKENHIRAAGGISAALSRLNGRIPATVKIEVETTNIAEVEEALKGGADIIMLDNMSVPDMKKAVALVHGRAQLEASGNITISNIEEVASTGVDFISTSATITAAPWADLSLLFKP